MKALGETSIYRMKELAMVIRMVRAMGREVGRREWLIEANRAKVVTDW